MTHDPGVRGLRLAYWLGAVLDGATVVPLLVPGVAGTMLGIDAFTPGDDYRYAAYVGAALMTGWTALLVWGAADPVARRGVLLLTAVPVVAGLVAAGAFAVGSGLVRPGLMAPVFTVQAVVLAVFTGAYRRAGRLRPGPVSPATLSPATPPRTTPPPAAPPRTTPPPVAPPPAAPGGR